MSDSEEEHYVKFGTPLDPLDEENLPRKKPMTIEDQYACDEQGRRRFHGAFTGGFSAGYFNTVGTRDGWRPQQFKSSRSSKAENKSQKPQDFMDDEDMGQFGIAPTAIRATSDYTEHDKKGTKRERIKYAGDGPIPGTPVLRDLLKPVKDTVGVKLLKQMGWKPGQGVGPRLSRKEKLKVKERNDKIRVYGCPLPPEQGEMMEADSAESDDEDSSITFAPDDYEPFRCNPKDNYFGIDYSGLDKRPILSQHLNLFEPEAFKLQEKNKKLSIRGQAFGVGAFEAEDEDIYSREDMSQYDFTLEPKTKQKSRWSNEKASTSQKKCIEGFTPAKNRLKTRKMFGPPELPKGFKPVHVIRKSRFEPRIESTSLENARRKGLARHDLRAEDRARIINDPNPITLVLSNRTGMVSKKVADPTKIQKHSEESSLFPGAIDDKLVRPVSNSSGNENDLNDHQISKKTSVISNIITKTLNLHGREQTARNQENNSRANTASKNSWLEKLSVKNFVKGGTETLRLNDGADAESVQEIRTEQTRAATSESSLDQRNEILNREPEETCDTSDSGNLNSTFRPFIANPDKQKRYEQFLAFSRVGEKEKLINIQPLSMVEWERDHERVEFEQAARLYKPLTGSMGDRFISGKHQDDLNPLSEVEKTKDADSQLKEAAKKKMFGKLTRQRIDWQPASVLCKRFNIAEPRTGCLKQETEKKAKFSVFDYLEESVHSSSTFQSVTDVAVGIKSERSNSTLDRNNLEKGLLDPHRSTAMKVANNSAMLMCDNADKDKVSAKERNFEVKYERIFGKNVHALESTERINSDGISPRTESANDSTVTEIFVDRNLDDVREPMEISSKYDRGGIFPGPSTGDEGIEAEEILANSIEAKKDLFKAIFLSSSEDSDSDKEEELDDEKLKSVLIGKNPGELNVQRNTSPPRGIFANLDLDSLNDVSVKNSKINFIEPKSTTTLNSKGDETSKASGSNQGKNKNDSDVEILRDVKNSINSTEIKQEPDLEILPDMYGPVLPAKPLKNAQDVPADASGQAQAQKHVFKSIVVPVVSSASSAQGEWIEKRKDKKLKKDKKKHKHKEHKKHKHKKHKR